jgi:biopolymer transport protein ExbD
MPIHVPGKRGRNGKMAGKKRSIVALLSLTAMVDMFTVLVVFLLQNYATTGQVLEIPEGVDLPEAAQVKELKPTNVVIITKKDILVNNDKVADLSAVKGQQDWMVQNLRKRVEEVIAAGEKDKTSVASKFKSAVEKIKAGDKKQEEEVDEFRRMTIQADKKLDFLTLKKIMYTVTEAGIYEINFAVMKEAEADEGTMKQ